MRPSVVVTWPGCFTPLEQRNTDGAVIFWWARSRENFRALTIYLGRHQHFRREPVRVDPQPATQSMSDEIDRRALASARATVGI